MTPELLMEISRYSILHYFVWE